MTAERRRNFSVSICNLSSQVFVKIFSHEAKLKKKKKFNPRTYKRAGVDTTLPSLRFFRVLS